MLVGRGAERARIDALLEGARAGRSGVLVLRGEPGIGKSALLDYAAERAEGFRVLRAIGVESESELAFSALHELVRPVLDRIESLPERQAAALRMALALAPAGQVDRFAVSVGFVSLLAEASHAEPLLCLLDDLQWIDQASADALRFASRRLDADPVTLLLAQRSDETTYFEAPELPMLVLGGLHLEAARSLLASAAPELASPLRERVIELAHGNPLALLEIPAALRDSPDAALDVPLPIGPRLERAFARRAEALDEPSQRALLVAAASETGEQSVIGPALAELGIDSAALDSAEQAALVRLAAGHVNFRHPLVRSAIYEAAPASRRRDAHRALAAALRAHGAIAPAAWHQAAASVGPDEEVAAALEAAAGEAQARGGLGAAARALERSARVTRDPVQRSRRLVAAGQAARAAGNAAGARRLVDEALSHPCDEQAWAQAQALLADLEYWEGREAEVLRLATTVERLTATDRSAAAAVLVRIAMTHGSTNLAPALRLTTQALELQPDDRLALSAQANYLFRLGHPDEALDACVRVAEAADQAGDWFAAAEAAILLGALERYAEADRLVRTAVAGLRAAGAVKDLSHALCAQVQIDTRRGDLRSAFEAGVTALDLAGDVDEPLQVGFAASFLAACEAWMGLGSEAREHAAQALRAIPGERSRTSLEARAAVGLLELQLGSPERAIAELEPVVAALGSLGIAEPGYVQALPELVEALVRGGRRDEAEHHLEELERQARATGRHWALAAAGRCRGLLAAESELDRCFAEAFEHHDVAARPLETARTQLAYGERLRRAGRRADARIELRAAMATFQTAGARLFAGWAAKELAASGERLRPASAAREELSPQERQVAFVIARGATNKEAAAELFVSPKTIEFHLRNAYRKLGVRSRTELANAVRSAPDRTT